MCLQHRQVKCAYQGHGYQGHRVKVKVTETIKVCLCIAFAGGLPSIGRQSLLIVHTLDVR